MTRRTTASRHTHTLPCDTTATSTHSTHGRTLLGGGRGRKEAASSLILGPQMKRWKRQREQAWRGGETSLSISRLFASCLFNHHYPLNSLQERVSWIFDSLNHFSLSSCSQPSRSLPLPGFLSLFRSPFLTLSLSFSLPSPSPGTGVNKQCCVGC